MSGGTRLSDYLNIDTTLTLIRAAGGVYDFQNFEEVQLCIHTILMQT
jgi:hypothetical protein